MADKIDIVDRVKEAVEERLSEKNLAVAAEMALEVMDEIKNRETQSGNSPTQGGRYKDSYSQQYIRSNPNKNQGSTVNLRSGYGAPSIENTKVRRGPGGKGAVLEFVGRTSSGRDAGKVFRYHQDGIQGMPQRKIYPTRNGEVPMELKKEAAKIVGRFLTNG